MPKVKLKPGRQAQEIGAAIVGAWLKTLPQQSTAITNMQLSPLRITIKLNGTTFVKGNSIAIRSADGNSLRGVKVGNITASDATSQTFKVVDANGTAVAYTINDPTLVNGAVIASDVAGANSDLKLVLQQIVDDSVNVTVVFDGPTDLTVAVPALPENVLTRDDLLDYLQDYHANAQGRHYHEELGSAVLFGCR